MTDRPAPEAGLAAKAKTERQSFLPIVTNAFDRIFIGVVLFVAIHLLWMRFLEAHLSLYVATALSVAIAAILVRWG
jgi:predicted small integral membrane protein